MAKERVCLFCGRSYQYCPNCREYDSYPKWMGEFDTEKCHDLYTVMSGYNLGLKTKEDVKTVLDKHNITDYSIFSSKLQEKLNNMFSVEIPKETEIEMSEETKEVEEEKQVVPSRNRRSKRKVYVEGANTEE